MRIELWLFLAAAAWMFHIYTEGRYVKNIYRYKKYYQMAGVFVGALFVYFLIRKNPMKTGEILQSSNEYIKYLPMDKNSADFMTPILDFTAKQGRPPAASSTIFPVLPVQQQRQPREHVLQSSGKKSTKRSVSETKKKYVAARQNWRCGKCQNQLSAWFEIDHKIRLEYGGSNHVDNLVALCRECHGEKTAMENL
jgi:HNH endonuclease